MMYTEIRDQWVEALESGEYKQCKGALTKIGADGNKSHCCLGVLTELAVKAGVIKEAGATLSGAVGYNVEGDSNLYSQKSVLPDAVRVWAGLSAYNGFNPEVTIGGGGRPVSLSYLNDEFGYDFEAIAGIIRDQL